MKCSLCPQACTEHHVHDLIQSFHTLQLELHSETMSQKKGDFQFADEDI